MALKFVDVTGHNSWSDITITDTQIHIQHKEDLTDLVEQNRFLQTLDPSELTNKKCGTRLIARISMGKYLEMMRIKRKHYADDHDGFERMFKRWLNDPSYLDFRATRGKV